MRQLTGTPQWRAHWNGPALLLASVLGVLFAVPTPSAAREQDAQVGEVWFTTQAGTVERIAWTANGTFAGPLKTVADDLQSPFKLAANPQTRQIGVAVGAKEEPALLLIDPGSGGMHTIGLSAEISDLAAAGTGFLIAASKGRFYFVEEDGTVAEWNARKELDPPGRKGEFVLPLPEESGTTNRALVSFQKDDGDSAARGNRLVLMTVNPPGLLHDLPLPRSHSDLHRVDDAREQGPGPEVVLASPETNTLMLTADLYGALAFADLDAALLGKWKNFAYVPTSADGKLGISFPDRATLIQDAARHFVLVSNASLNGGLALFDVKKRELVQFFPASAGADPPLFFPELRLAATVISGKVKSHSPEDGAKKEAAPGNHLLLLDFENPQPGETATLHTMDLGGKTLRIARAGRESCVVFLDSPSGPEALLVDLREKKILDRVAVSSPPVRVLALTR